VPALPHPQPAQYKNLIVLDPAHGGTDAGASISASTPEKALTLAFAAKLKPLLAAQGFSVVTTRDNDPGEVLASDQRAGVANHARPLACLVLHFTADGGGVHLATSSLAPSDATASRFAVRWATAQAGMVTQSLALSHDLSVALDAAHLPAVEMRASVPPLDNMICPAVAVEIAPHKVKDGQPTAVTDGTYQQSVAHAIVAALMNYRTEVFPASASPASAATPEDER
jgi:N-acetylmuramoyl-L-alanine amidase